MSYNSGHITLPRQEGSGNIDFWLSTSHLKLTLEMVKKKW